MNASFNQWNPIEMKTSFEIRTIKTNTRDGELEKFLEKALVGIPEGKSK